MNSLQLSFTELVHGVAQLDFKEYEKFFSTVNQIRVRQRPGALAKNEAALLAKINAGFEVTKWLRMQVLDEKMEDDTLNDGELDELSLLTTEYEKYCLKRIRLIKRLALIRNASLEETIHQLGISHGKA